MSNKDFLRNIAIIAHVDHGKTTLVDQLLIQSGLFRENEHVAERAMDSHDLERERGITILAKNTAVPYKNYTINILDTPGHADFGGEVERILKMVDGVLLVVDAFEGCMPQTRFVLRKALERQLTPVVVVNKMDRPNARPAEVLDEIYDLFIDLEASEEQLDFPVLYASGVNGWATTDPELPANDLHALFETILTHIPAPDVDPDGPLQMQLTMLDYNDYLGRIGIGRIERGTLQRNDDVVHIHRDGTSVRTRISKLFGFVGLKRVDVSKATAGDIVAVAGLEELNVGETIADPDQSDALPLLAIDEPTLKMTFLVNNGPFAGREGTHVTSRKLRERLFAEQQKDVSLRVEETDSSEAFVVSGRGELHLSILIETMRREGYEFQVSKPQVIMREIDGVRMEPFEHVTIDVPEDYMGTVMESLGARKAEMTQMEHLSSGSVRLEFTVPARGLIGYQGQFLTETRGYGMMNHSFDSYRPQLKGTFTTRKSGALIAYENGKATTYGLMAAEERGILFVDPGTDVYEGMIVGEHARDNDLAVNVCKEKHVTNMRSATKDETVKLKGVKHLSLEEAIQFLADDEYCEVTPQSFRLRKKYLTKSERTRYAKQLKYTAKEG
ncbi:translational GTPase TypA [Numidum massiliense]|uniref:translational GTPase TypA n=1 Tax=Numidum massiliense TaxID=1522315 RepID=UPI0006D56C91|nr:translational GTPase TypA [Numidum massiliense]